jgi:prepilin-type N-terminal cleavage/methylation domain-containing protein
MTYSTSQLGFSLIETLVAVTILLIVIVGPLSISTMSARSSSYSSEQVVAFFLAQEGIELVQKARDDLLIPYFNSSNPDPWVDFTRTSAGGSYRRCYVSFNADGCGLTINTDTTGTLITPIDCDNTGVACRLYYNDDAGNIRSRYTHTVAGHEATPFTRRIYLELVGTDEVRVRSVVTWRTGSLRTEQQVSVESRLFNIYGN